MAKISRDVARPCTRDGDVHRLPEIVLPLVERYRDARTDMDADLQDQVLAAALVVQLPHRFAHPERRGDGAVGRRERRHHRIADRLHHRARLRGDDLVQHVEVRPHEVEGDEIPYPLVELGRAAQVGEEEGQAGDLQPLVDVERVGAVDVAEGLVGEQPLGGQERPPLAIMSCRSSSAMKTAGRIRRSVWFSTVSRSGPGRISIVRCGVLLVEDDGQRLALLRRLALHVDELRRMRDRIEDDDELRWQLQREDRLLARRQIERFER